MYYFPIHSQRYYSCTSNKRLILGTALVALVFAFVLGNTGFDKRALIVLIGLPLFLVFLFNTDIIIIASIILLFVNINTLVYKIVVLSSIPVTISYFITNKADESNKITNPLTVPLLIYLACMLPSFWNIYSLFSSLINLLNFVSIIVMFTVLGIHVKDQKQIKSFSIAFLILSLLNGINVIAEGYLTRQRVFGFAGIMYVDYVCVAILIAGIISFYFRNIKSIFFIAACLVLFAALLFTQTRNTLISLVLTLIFLLLFLFINSALFSINRKKLFFQLLIFLAGLALILIVLSLIVPEIFSRIMEIFVNKPHTSSNDSLVSNSLISRLLIWHTALNAFFRHPIIGIGAYSFYFDSQHYRTIPLFLYKDFVKNLSSHITYLSVLTETGIVGIIGFLIFLLSTLKMGYTSVKYSKSITNKYYSLGIFIVQIYIFFSMCFTDAWLWGQCGMLWSIILGLSVGNYKIIMRENTSFGKK